MFPLRKKGNKRFIIVSEFLIKAIKHFQISQNQQQYYFNIFYKAHVIFNFRKNQEGYWIAHHIAEQLKTKAILIFNAFFSNNIIIFTFDNSSNHSAYSDNILIANQMLLNIIKKGQFLNT